MQRLILMRHAEAERASPSGDDRDRVLSARGRADAMQMGRTLASKGLRPDLALVSAAARTRQTWDLAHEAFGDVDLREQDGLYNAGADTLRRAVEAVEAAVEIQQAMLDQDPELPEAERIRYRVGINLGDVIVDRDGKIVYVAREYDPPSMEAVLDRLLP